MPNKLSCGNIIIHYIFSLVNKEIFLQSISDCNALTD